MQSSRQDRAFSFISKVITVSALTAVAPFVAVALVPLVMFLLPVAFIAMPFMMAAFFGETKVMLEPQPVGVLRPQFATT